MITWIHVSVHLMNVSQTFTLCFQSPCTHEGNIQPFSLHMLQSVYPQGSEWLLFAAGQVGVQWVFRAVWLKSDT